MADDLFEAKFLLPDELDYELRIRALKPKNNRLSKIKTLSRAVKTNVATRVDPTYAIATETEIINGTLENITAAIIDLDENFTPHSIEFKRVKSRIVH